MRGRAAQATWDATGTGFHPNGMGEAHVQLELRVGVSRARGKDMELSIKNEEAEHLARELAASRGEPTEAILAG